MGLFMNNAGNFIASSSHLTRVAGRITTLTLRENWRNHRRADAARLCEECMNSVTKLLQQAGLQDSCSEEAA